MGIKLETRVVVVAELLVKNLPDSTVQNSVRNIQAVLFPVTKPKRPVENGW